MTLRRLITSSLFALTATVLHAQTPPHLLLGPEDFTRLNQLAATQGWAADTKHILLKEADAFPASYEHEYGLTTPELPPEGGSWYHLYVCPSGTRLTFHPPNQNICPDTGKSLNGWPYDQFVYGRRASDLGHATLALALAYRFTQKESYAQQAADLLTRYADAYLKYPVHYNDGSNNPKGARVFSQPLDEAIWLINMAWAYDLINDSPALTPANRKHIENDLLRPGTTTVGHVPGSTHNIQSWVNGAIAAVGFTLNDKSLITQAIDGENGFHAQMKTCVLDGFWLEGAWHYQFYALDPLERTAQMATRAGIPLWSQEPNLTALLASPVGLMFPDGSLPAFNDSETDNLFQHKPLYETAYNATKNPLFAAIASHGGRGKSTHAGDGDLPGMLEAFLFGATSLPATAMPTLQSQSFPRAGYATLRSPSGDMMEILKFAPFVAPHSHLDSLGEVLYADGAIQSVDPGTQLYGAPSHKTWDTQTVAHNTIVVDEQTQKPSTGELLYWSVTPTATIATADAGKVYPQADLQRTLVMTQDYILEITTATTKDGHDHDFDWCYHNYGKESFLGTLTPASNLPQTNGYQHLAPAMTATMHLDLQSTFTTDSAKGISLWMLNQGPATQVFAGSALGPNLKIKVPYLIARRHGKAAEFITLFQSLSATAKVTTFASTANTITIRSATWQDTITRGDAPTVTRKPLP